MKVTQAPAGPAAFLEALVRTGRRLAVPQPVTRRAAPEDPARSRVRWQAEFLKRDAIGWLAAAGGWRVRQVVVGGRRQQGRIWDPRIWERLGVAFSAAPLLLAERMAQTTLRAPELDDALAARLAASGAGEPKTGDLVALHRVCRGWLQSLEREGLEGIMPWAQVAAEGDDDPLGARTERHARLLFVRIDGARSLAVIDTNRTPPRVATSCGRAFEWELALGAFRDAAEPQGRRWQRALIGRRPVRRAGVGAGVHVYVLLPSRGTYTDPDQREVLQALDELREVAVHEPQRRKLDPGSQGALRRMLELSPLTLLSSPQSLGALSATPEEAAARLRPLFAGDRATVVRYLDQHLARAWLAEDAARRAGGEPPLEEYQAAGRGLQGFALAAAERPDALSPLLEFYQRYLLRYGGREPVVGWFRERSRGFRQASARERFVLAGASLFTPVEQLLRHVERALGRAFVDRSEEEKVLLTDYHERFKPIADELSAIRRELAGEVG
ncbi:MAG: hypothetical protein KDD82_07115 [Planctomycetes bacterium]|nr:hypothetical protein [Planctomycetota bacterium]